MDVWIECEKCKKGPDEVNHPIGMIFVGWGHGWQPCPHCGGAGRVLKTVEEVKENRMRRPGWIGYALWTLVLCSMWWFGFEVAYMHGWRGAVEAEVAANQLSDSSTSLAGLRLVEHVVPFVCRAVFVLCIWLTWQVRSWRLEMYETRLRRVESATKVALVALVLPLAGCWGPARVEQFVEIGPNETAYVIPLEGATNRGQAKFDSVAFLEAKKVAAKRVSLPLREKSTGRMWMDYEWIPTARVVKVDRAPVTREWTFNPGTGTGHGDQSLHMQSIDSIAFHCGATITVSIPEEDASTFLYNFGGRALHEVVDTNIRSYVLGELSSKFASIPLEEGMKQKAEFFVQTGKDATAYFKQKGVTLDYFGIEGGMGYDAPAVQASLDRKFMAENDKQIAQNELAAQQVRNQTAVSKAAADAEAAAKFAAAKDALTVKTQMEALILQAQATKIAAEKWDGHINGVVPAGSGLLFGLDKAQGH